jgi:hypothetical protein
VVVGAVAVEAAVGAAAVPEEEAAAAVVAAVVEGEVAAARDLGSEVSFRRVSLRLTSTTRRLSRHRTRARRWRRNRLRSDAMTARFSGP